MSPRLTLVPPDRDEAAALWCLRMTEETALTAQEQVELDEWMADPANAAAFRDQAEVWNLTEIAAGLPEFIHLRQEALEQYRSGQATRWVDPAPPSWWRRPIMAVAAVLLIVIAGLGGLLYDPSTTYRTGHGERQVVMLADGSRLSLDADSAVKVRMRADRRDLELLAGRAGFQVAKDPLRPFVVEAGNRQVVATGTRFTVEMLASTLSVLLYEGHVTVLDRAAAVRREWVLDPGTMLTASATGAGYPATRPIGDPQSLAWEEGRLSFTDEPLSTALLRINRYAVHPLTAGDASAARTRVTGVFVAGDTEAFIEGVTAVGGLEAQRRADRIVLTAASPRRSGS